MLYTSLEVQSREAAVRISVIHFVQRLLQSTTELPKQDMKITASSVAIRCEKTVKPNGKGKENGTVSGQIEQIKQKRVPGVGVSNYQGTFSEVGGHQNKILKVDH